MCAACDGPVVGYANHFRPSPRCRPLLQPRPLAEQHPFRPILSAPLLHDPALKRSAGDAVHLPGRNDLEHRRQRRLRQPDRAFLLRLHDVEMGGVERTSRLDIYAVPPSRGVRHGHRAPAREGHH